MFIGFAMLEPSHSSQRSRIHNQPEKKNQNRDSGPVRKPSRKPPELSLQPRGPGSRQNRFLAAIWGQNSPRMVSESVRLGSPSTPEIDLVNIFAIQISFSSKKPPTPEWLGVPKMHLTRKFLFSKAFHQTKKPKNTENRSFYILFKIPKLVAFQNH